MLEKLNCQEFVERMKRLGEQERFYRSLFENSSDLLFRTDLRGRFVYVSPSVYELTGYTVEEIVGMTMAEEVYLFPQELEKFVSVLQEEGRVRNFESRFRRKDGSTWWASTNAHFYRDRKGRIVGVEGIARDITALKSTELALRESEANLARAQNVAHIGNWSWDVATNRVLWSDEFYRIAGLSPKEFDAVYENYLECIHPDDLGMIRRLKQNALKEKISFSVEYRIVRTDNEIRFVYEQGDVTLDSAGNVVNLFGIVQDITEYKKIDIYEKILPLCSFCKKIRDDRGKAHGEGEWQPLEHYLKVRADLDVSHGLCPQCYEEHYGELLGRHGKRLAEATNN